MSDRRIVTISYTALHAGGGVPKFNRDLHAAFPDRQCLHFCWEDYPFHARPDMHGVPEWDRAKLLNLYLIQQRIITKEDVVVADGFWAEGLMGFPYAISHSHGIWSHLTKEDVDADKAPDMPFHHTAQVSFRRRWVRGALGYLTAVSEFIADQMQLQWDFPVDRVINNGVDTDLWKPRDRHLFMAEVPLIVHGVNDRGNTNKGWDHIEALKGASVGFVESLDELFDQFHHEISKQELMASADLIVHPSGYEGNSMFVAEALACGVPIVAYNVGALADIDSDECGYILERSERSPETTLKAVKFFLNHPEGMASSAIAAREYAVEKLSLNAFVHNWGEFIEEIEK